MKSTKQTMNAFISKKPSQLVLAIVFILYLLFNIQTPEPIATYVDTMYGKIIIAVLSILIFMKTNPIIGVLGFIVAYQMIKTASVSSGTYGMKHYLPSEKNKQAEMESFNENIPSMSEDNTLEEETVHKMAPLVIHGGDSDLDYKPVMDGLNGASLLEYEESSTF